MQTCFKDGEEYSALGCGVTHLAARFRKKLPPPCSVQMTLILPSWEPQVSYIKTVAENSGNRFSGYDGQDIWRFGWHRRRRMVGKIITNYISVPADISDDSLLMSATRQIFQLTTTHRFSETRVPAPLAPSLRLDEFQDNLIHGLPNSQSSSVSQHHIYWARKNYMFQLNI